MANFLTNGVQKIIYISLREVINDRLLVLPSPSEFSWDFGFEQQEISQTSDLGETYVADVITTSKNPKITAVYGSLTKELLALKTGYKLASQADTGIYARTLQVKQGTIAPVITGQDGFGMVADTCSASVLRKGISIPLTRQPFATSGPLTVDSFANGANATFKFSDEIVAAKEWVTVYGTYPLTEAEVLSEEPFDTFTASLVGILHDKTVFNIVFDPVVLSRADSNTIDFGADTQELTFSVTDPSCVPQVKFLNRLRTC